MATIWEGFDPMREDHSDPRVNTYNTGPGNRMPLERQPFYKNGYASPDSEEEETLKLYVARVPKDLTETGLRNFIDSVKCPAPVSVKLLQSAKDNKESKFRFAFLEFDNQRDASQALQALNRRPPYYFRVSFARKVGDKERKERFIEEEYKKYLLQTKKRETSDEELPEMKDSPLPLNKSRMSSALNELSSSDKLVKILDTRYQDCSICNAPEYKEHLHYVIDDGSVVDPDSEIPQLSDISCSYCKQPAAPGFQVCSNCLSAFYCNRTCQRSHWKNHACTLGAVKTRENSFANGDIRPKAESVGKANDHKLKSLDAVDNVAYSAPTKRTPENKLVDAQVRREPVEARDMKPKPIESKEVVPKPVEVPKVRKLAEIPTSPVRVEDTKKEPSKGDLETIGGDLPPTVVTKIAPATRREMGQQMFTVNEMTAATITFGFNPDNFFVQKSEDSEKATFITACLTTECPKIDKWAEAKSLGVNQYCAGLFESDGLWYRAKLLHKSGDNYHIKFIDYGNVETVKEKALRPLPPQLYDTPALAIHCKLHDVKPASGTSWNEEAIETFGDLGELGIYKLCKVYDHDSDNTFAVDLLGEKGESLAQALIDRKHAILASAVETPNEVQSVAKTSAFRTPLTNNIPGGAEEKAVSPPKKEQPAPQLQKLPSLNREVERSPEQAPPPAPVPVPKVTPVAAPVASKPIPKSASFRQLLAKKSEEIKELPCEIDSFKEKESFQCILTTDCDLATYRYCLMFNPDLYCTLSNMLSEELGPNAVPVKSSDVKKGLIAAAKASDDEWGRVHVMRVNEDGSTLCLFVDTGYTETVEKLYTLPSSLYSSPSLFALAKVFGSFSQNALKNLKCDEPMHVHVMVQTVNVVDGRREVVARVKFEEVDLVCNMILKHYKEAYVEMLEIIEAKERESVAVKDPVASLPRCVLQKSEVDVLVVYVCEEDPSEFFVLGDAEAIRQLLEDLAAQVVTSPKATAKVGLRCLGLCHSDGDWYRAVVTEINGDKCKVYYVDFGNYDEIPCDDLKELGESLALETNPAQAIRCKLVESTPEALRKVEKAFSEQTQLKLEVVSDEGSHYTVTC